MILRNLLFFLCLFAIFLAPFGGFASDDYKNPIIDADYSDPAKVGLFAIGSNQGYVEYDWFRF